MQINSETAAFLTADEVSALLTAAHSAHVTPNIHADGSETLTYVSTPESEAAMDALVRAFLPAINRAARGSKVLEVDEAEAVALEEFVKAVRDYDAEEIRSFAGHLPARLAYAVRLADRTSDTVAVPDATAARYWRVMHRNGHDLEAAFQDCRAGAAMLDPYTFLAAHRAITGGLSMDFTSRESAEHGTSGDWIDSEYDPHGIYVASSVPGPEEAVVQEHLIDWLFGLEDVTTRQESILRLKYAFTDAATEDLRSSAGLPAGAELDDDEVGAALSLTRPTVQRDRSKALRSMREAMASLVAEEDA